MRKLIQVTTVLGLAFLICMDGCGNSVSRDRDKWVKQFLACIPDSLGDEHRDEIRGLFEQFWVRADRNQVFDEDIKTIETTLFRYIDKGRIGPDSLLYFMAEVGYYTYRKDPRYNLPEKIVDHPTLNPDAALIQFGRDSTGQGGYRMFYRVPSADSTSDSTILRKKIPGK
jgi:hypothetical protein